MLKTANTRGTMSRTTNITHKKNVSQIVETTNGEAACM